MADNEKCNAPHHDCICPDPSHCVNKMARVRLWCAKMALYVSLQTAWYEFHERNCPVCSNSRWPDDYSQDRLPPIPCRAKERVIQASNGVTNMQELISDAMYTEVLRMLDESLSEDTLLKTCFPGETALPLRLTYDLANVRKECLYMTELRARVERLETCERTEASSSAK